MHGRRARRRSLGALLAFGLLGLIVAGCGISLSAEEDESEIFRELTVEAGLTAGDSLSLILDYDQPYPVGVIVVCELSQDDRGPEGQGSWRRILRERLPPNPEGGPVGEATPVSDTIQRSVPGPERPGRYIVRCFTEEDDDNDIERPITIAPAPTATPTPEAALSVARRRSASTPERRDNR